MSQLKVTITTSSKNKEAPWTGWLHCWNPPESPDDCQFALIEDEDGKIHTIREDFITINRPPESIDLVGRNAEVYEFSTVFDGANPLVGVGTILFVNYNQGLAFLLMPNKLIRSINLTTLKII